MLRPLMLAAIAVGLGLFGASLLRTERRLSGPREEEPAPGGMCAARTRSGAPCSRPAEPGSDRCWQHR
jgi:hypothetical protein